MFEAAESTDGDSGFKRSLTSVLDKLMTMGFDKETMWREIEECCVKTIIAGQPGLAHMFKAVFRKSLGFNCFEVLGFDIMLDEGGKPWMIEVCVASCHHPHLCLASTQYRICDPVCVF